MEKAGDISKTAKDGREQCERGVITRDEHNGE